MSEPFLAEIRVMGFNFAPVGWAKCDGQLLPISQNTALFSLLGTFYGGDGKATFALPNLGDSVPMQAGQGPGLNNRDLGEASGSQTSTLLDSEIPVHNHSLMVSTQAAIERQPPGRRAAVGDGVGLYDEYTQPSTTMHFSTLAISGGSQPHENMMPSLGLNFCIAMQGVFPSRG
jgi:microcystin-dependent protein